MTTFGIIGAGRIGSTLAKTLADHGHTVVIANSRGPESLQDLVADLGPNVSAATADDAAAAAEIAVVTVPFGRVREIPAQPLAGKVVLDTNNYYVERDGQVPELDRGEATTSGIVQEHFRDSKVVKAFNHINAGDIIPDATPAGTPERRALAIASDFPDAIETVTALQDELGFDTVVIGSLSESWRVERDRPVYGKRQTRASMEAGLAAANRVP